MHVAVIGAGALGAVYGVRLATRTKTSVTFVVRPARVASTDPLVIELVRGDLRETLASPARAAAVPADADVVLLAVGTEDLDAIRAPLVTTHAPIVVLTPMLPRDHARMRGVYGDRVLAALPSVVSYTRSDGVVRYWLPPVATRIDEPRAGGHADAVRALAASLTEAGLPARLELGVHETNPATTVCFIPLGMALSLAGSLDALARDAELVDLARRACAEGVALGRSIGRPEIVGPLSPLVARPLLLGAAARVLRRFSPEAVFYAEEHFGRKLRAQHLVMAREMRALAAEKGVAHAAIDALAAKIEARASTAS
jgi:2-dehydropantoate 2-reductase